MIDSDEFKIDSDLMAQVEEINKMFECQKMYIKIPIFGLVQRAKSKDRVSVTIKAENEQIENLIGDFDKNSVYRMISVKGGFSSFGFIEYVSEMETIEELYVCSLAVGKKQIEALDRLRDDGKIVNAKFVLGTIFKDRGLDKKYDYYDRFVEICKKNKWKYVETNNHSKLLLMKTKNNYYVLESSSNLNDNPKIEQFCFQENKGIYEFYESFVKEI